KDGRIFLDEYQVSMDELEDHLKRLVAGQKKQLFLRADKEVPYGTVVQVMGEIKAAGIDKLGIVAEEPRDRNRK
ncbi:ExbD/TolR family protein, partial [Pseudodesulfovibrio karagichevae]